MGFLGKILGEIVALILVTAIGGGLAHISGGIIAHLLDLEWVWAANENGGLTPIGPWQKLATLTGAITFLICFLLACFVSCSRKEEGEEKKEVTHVQTN
ncbi:MAG: hypothetical protein NTU97_01965 [Candidatus Magasanikbacteria bacterium]|nr:hypothetical protein [Candidatus Magasanikbacteria bacterium]